jgi:cell division protein FtsB
VTRPSFLEGRSTASAPRTRRVAATAAAVAVAAFAVQGGEYSTLDIFRQHARRATLKAEIDSLHHQVDSLTRLVHAIETDPAVQERIAREEFGMVRGNKEIVYRFAPPGVTTGSAPRGQGQGARDQTSGNDNDRH